MKKMKKILAVLSSVSMMLGTMGMSTFADEVRNEYGRTLSEQALYDAENAKEQLAELLAELEEMGYTENEQTKFLESYIDGALEVAASGATYTATSTESKLYEIPENITSIKELEDFITSPVKISAEDFVWLNTKLTKEELEELVAYFNMESDNISDKLVEYLKTNGIDEEESSSLVKSYYEGALEVIESGITYTVTPTALKTDEAELLRLINEAKAEEQQAEVVKFGTPTIAGDIDMNGEYGMADITKLAKYTSNAELFPIEDSTALANADVTQDGVIDQLDTNMLIEMALGTYESAL